MAEPQVIQATNVNELGVNSAVTDRKKADAMADHALAVKELSVAAREQASLLGTVSDQEVWINALRTVVLPNMDRPLADISQAAMNVATYCNTIVAHFRYNFPLVGNSSDELDL